MELASVGCQVGPLSRWEFADSWAPPWMESTSYWPKWLVSRLVWIVGQPTPSSNCFSSRIGPRTSCSRPNCPRRGFDLASWLCSSVHYRMDSTGRRFSPIVTKKGYKYTGFYTVFLIHLLLVEELQLPLWDIGLSSMSDETQVGQ